MSPYLASMSGALLLVSLELELQSVGESVDVSPPHNWMPRLILPAKRNKVISKRLGQPVSPELKPLRPNCLNCTIHLKLAVDFVNFYLKNLKSNFSLVF